MFSKDSGSETDNTFIEKNCGESFFVNKLKETMYSRLPNSRGVPNKSVGGKFPT